jgi:hypothetical protein
MDLDRRTFLQGLSGSVLAATTWGLPKASLAARTDSAEALATELLRSLNDAQRAEVAFPWDHIDGDRGLLRARVSANWNVTKPSVDSDFFTNDQRALIRATYEQLIDPAWHERYDRKQLDDAGGWGRHQSIAFFGDPATGLFQFLMTGRHMTLRAGGQADPRVAFGGPIFYGHATGTWWSGSFVERSHHPGNVFFPQAVAATDLFDLLDGAQRERARITQVPEEFDITFSASGAQRGLPLSGLSRDQLEEAGRLIEILVEPFRERDRAQVSAALAAQGGLAASSLSFFEPWYRRGDDLWDGFRLEGPSLTWHFRGYPHVHVWAHIAKTPDVPFNSIAIEL